MAGEPENQRIVRLTPLADVRARIEALAAPVAPRTSDLSGALHRVLAEDIAAEAARPSEARTLVDGYAVRADEIADAGSYAPIPLAQLPVRVDAGDELPPGTDAVVPLDAIVNRGGHYQAVAPGVAGEGVLPAQGDMAAGTVIARAGWRLSSLNVAMLAANGTTSIQMREPRIRLVEVRSPAAGIGDFISRALAALGCVVTRNTGDFAAALVEDGCDAVVGIGGTGSGRNDTSVGSLAAHGRVEAHGIAITPGETAAFGMCGRRAVLLLPGRIDAAIAGWLTLGLPLIERLSGSGDSGDCVVRAALARKVASPLGLVEVVPVRLAKGKAEPIASGYWPLAALAGTDGWFLVSADSEGFPAGTEVVVRRWS
jgi:molybdopterin molybdotransferase